jgi:hypothetical protein
MHRTVWSTPSTGTSLIPTTRETVVALSLGALSDATTWLPSRPWFTGDGELQQVGAYRFDDTAGEVGLEALLVQSGGGEVMHVPLTYRGMPLPGADEFLVGTAEHSVLGARWVYDGCRPRLGDGAGHDDAHGRHTV